MMPYVYVTLPTSGVETQMRRYLENQPIGLSKMCDIILKAWEIKQVDESEYVDTLYSMVFDELSNTASVQEALNNYYSHFEDPTEAMDRAADVIVAKAHGCGLRLKTHLEQLLHPIMVDLNATIDKVIYEGAFFIVSLETNTVPLGDRTTCLYQSWRQRQSFNKNKEG